MIFKKINNFFEDFIQQSPRNADQPYIPQPPEVGVNSDPNKNINFYQETDTDIENIAGTSINFGPTEKLVVDEKGNASRISQKQGHILGSGILVTNLNPIIKDGIDLPGVGGACSFCKQEAFLLLQANLISIEEAERRSLFDTNSAAQCGACGRRDLCIRHCRPFEKADGIQVSLCPDCAKAAQREKWVATALNLLLSPVVDEKRLLPGNTEEKYND